MRHVSYVFVFLVLTTGVFANPKTADAGARGEIRDPAAAVGEFPRLSAIQEKRDVPSLRPRADRDGDSYCLVNMTCTCSNLRCGWTGCSCDNYECEDKGDASLGKYCQYYWTNIFHCQTLTESECSGNASP